MSVEELQKLVDAGKLKADQAAALGKIAAGALVAHKSWGIGRVKELDAVFGRLIVDFPNKAGHSFDLAYAAQSLTALPPDHIAARKLSELAGLQALAKAQPLELLRIVLASHDNRASADEVAADLCGSVLTESEWKSWWDKTKRAAKADGHFAIPSKKTEPITLRQAPKSHADVLVETFRSKHGLKEKVQIAEQWKTEQATFDPNNPTAREFAAEIAQLLERHPPRHATVALEAIWLLTEFGEASPIRNDALATRERAALAAAGGLAKLADELPSYKFARLLVVIKLTQSDWVARLLALANDSPARRMSDIIDYLLTEKQSDVALRWLTQAVREISIGSEFLFWLAKNRSTEIYRPLVAPLLGPRFLASALATIEQDAIDAPRRSRHNLRELLLADETLFGELLVNVPEDEAQQIAERVLRSNVIDEQSKRSLMGKFIKLYPPLQALVASTAPPKAEPLYVSAESLTRKQAEYDDLVNKQIPDNARQIAIARSYGDLSENHEFKSAKEQQGLLNRHRAEMERDLSNARITNFESAIGDVVAIGTRVVIHDDATGNEHEYAILGAWDSDPANGVISYLSPIAKALINKRVGDEADVEVDGAKRRVKIGRIVSWKSSNAAVAATS